MSGSLAFRSFVATGAAVASLAAGACRDDPVPATDTSAGQVGVIDSAPASVATGVAALLSDENVFAYLDTAFAVMIQIDRLGQEKANAQSVNQFAAQAVSENTVTRSGVVSTAERLNISPMLPDRDVIREYAAIRSELQARTGTEFDRAYLERAIEVRKGLIDEIDDALEGGGVRQEPVRGFLSDVRVSLDASRKTAEELRAKIG